VDRRADVYALGCVLFEMLTERPPYRRDSMFATMVAQVDDPVPSLRETAPDVPGAIDDVVNVALAKAPDDRFPSAGDLARAARAAVSGARPRDGSTPPPSTTTDWEGHVIVAGLGAIGSRLAANLTDESSAPVAGLRDQGIHVLTGDAAAPQLLDQARVAHARHVIVACGEDGSNLNIANVVERERGADQPTVLTAFVHVDDPALTRTLTADAAQRPGPRDMRLEFFNARAAGTRLLLARHPPFQDGEGRPVAAPRIAVVGQGPTATELTVSIASEWQLQRRTDSKLPMVIIGPSAGGHLRDLVSAYPQLADICELEAREADTRSARFQSGDMLVDAQGECTLTEVYVALDDESAALSAALTLHGQPATRGVPIVVVLDDETSAVAGALRGSVSYAHNVHPFGLLTAALTPTVVLRGTNEVLARANHMNYVRNQRDAGAPDHASLAPWEDLPESLRNSNRRFADSIGSALEAIGYIIVPATPLDPIRSLPAFADDEVELLGRREHDRWLADLLRDGWRFTEGEKDPVRKLHPLLVPWADLTEIERDKDRDAVQGIPQLLAQAGLSAIRSRVGVGD
jgi:voltage-gated potassium channel Kch